MKEPRSINPRYHAVADRGTIAILHDGVQLVTDRGEIVALPEALAGWNGERVRVTVFVDPDDNQALHDA